MSQQLLLLYAGAHKVPLDGGLDRGFLYNHSLWLFNISCSRCTQDIVSGVVSALLLFAVSVPMEISNGELTENNGIIEFFFNEASNINTDDIKMLFNLDQLIPASGAAAVCCY